MKLILMILTILTALTNLTACSNYPISPSKSTRTTITTTTLRCPVDYAYFNDGYCHRIEVNPDGVLTPVITPHKPIVARIGAGSKVKRPRKAKNGVKIDCSAIFEMVNNCYAGK